MDKKVMNELNNYQETILRICQDNQIPFIVIIDDKKGYHTSYGGTLTEKAEMLKVLEDTFIRDEFGENKTNVN